jgi:hypothetical protein
MLSTLKYASQYIAALQILYHQMLDILAHNLDLRDEWTPIQVRGATSQPHRLLLPRHRPAEVLGIDVQLNGDSLDCRSDPPHLLHALRT